MRIMPKVELTGYQKGGESIHIFIPSQQGMLKLRESGNEALRQMTRRVSATKFSYH